MNNADKPINPIPEDIRDYSGNFDNRFSGLSKREYFAGLAMQGLLANPQYWKRVYKTLSSLKANKDSIECVFTQFSIKLADEILKQLEEK